MAWFGLLHGLFVLTIANDDLRGYQGILLCKFVILFPSSLNLRVQSVFLEFQGKIINSIFLTLRGNLIALNHQDEFFKINIDLFY